MSGLRLHWLIFLHILIGLSSKEYMEKDTSLQCLDWEFIKALHNLQRTALESSQKTLDFDIEKTIKLNLNWTLNVKILQSWFPRSCLNVKRKRKICRRIWKNKISTPLWKSKADAMIISALGLSNFLIPGFTTEKKLVPLGRKRLATNC